MILASMVAFGFTEFVILFRSGHDNYAKSLRVISDLDVSIETSEMVKSCGKGTW